MKKDDVQEVPIAVAITIATAKAEQCQKIFQYIMNDRKLTRLDILDYLLNETEKLTKLAQQELMILNQEGKVI